MPQERLSMRKITEVLRLKHERNVSNRKIVTSCQIGKTTVANYLHRAKKRELGDRLKTLLIARQKQRQWLRLPL